MQQRSDHSDLSPAVKGFAAHLVAWRNVLLGIGVIIAVLSVEPASRLRFDRSMENMFAEDDPVLIPYRRAKEIFSDDEIALAAYRDPELMTPAGITRVAEATERLSAVPGVGSVLSLSNSPFGTDIIDQSQPLHQSFVELFENYTVSTDRQTTALVCLLKPEADSKVSREETVDQLRAVIDDYPGGVVTGEPAMIVDGFRYLETDSVVLGNTATVLLVITILVSFRSFRWVIVPLATVVFTLLATKALLVLGNFRLTMVSSMLWAIIFVIGISATVHVIIRFREERHAGRSPRDSLYFCAATLALPILWTCLTDAAGFGSLLWAKVGPIRDFGVMMLCGSLIAIVSMCIMIPGLSILGSIDADPRRAWGERGLDFGLGTIIHFINRWPKTIGVFAALVAGTAIYGSRWVQVETDFTKNFRASSPLVRSYQFVERELGGAGVWDIFLPAPAEPDWNFVAKVRRLEERLRTETQVPDEQGLAQEGLTKVFSVVDAIDALNLGSLADNFSVPMLMDQMRGQMPAIMNVLWGQDPGPGAQHYLRIMLRAKERQPSAQKQQLIDEVLRISREEFGSEAQVTGFFVLLTQLINSILRDQWVTFLIASSMIGAMMLFAFRSLPVAMVAMIPNSLPIMIVNGLMGWLGVDVNMGAAMIAAVSMGLSVDSSVHYITEYLDARRSGYGVNEALAMVHQRVGRAVIFSTVALVSGFSALMLSQFIPLVYFGALMGLTMVGGSIGNLVVLPLLLKLVERLFGIRGAAPG
ncbi:MAG: MMPL family transporter [Pirellulales bacterium]|nr:MMPL family transporter [Pirellulales bacterium]